MLGLESTVLPMSTLQDQFGDIDIYVFDQLLRGRITPAMRVLDAGCGSGRNLRWLAANGARVFAVDRDAAAVERVRELGLDEQHARVAEVDALPFEDDAFDAVLAVAVLHFARGEEHFAAMLDELARVLRPGGILFTRLASSIGLEGRLHALGNRQYELPDGTRRFLVDEPFLLAQTARLGGELVDPLKTTNVQGLRCMTTWVVRTATESDGALHGPTRSPSPR